MYFFTKIWIVYGVNVGKYTIHWVFGYAMQIEYIVDKIHVEMFGHKEPWICETLKVPSFPFGDKIY